MYATTYNIMFIYYTNIYTKHICKLYYTINIALCPTFYFSHNNITTLIGTELRPKTSKKCNTISNLKCTRTNTSYKRAHSKLVCARVFKQVFGYMHIAYIYTYRYIGRFEIGTEPKKHRAFGRNRPTKRIIFLLGILRPYTCVFDAILTQFYYTV